MHNHEAENGFPSPGGSLEALREQNLARVIAALRLGGSISRTELARRTGISRTTVASLLAALAEAGLVREEAAPSAPTSQGGRPPVLVALEPRSAVAIGVDFDHDGIRVAVADLSHTILADIERDLDVDADAARALDVAVELVNEALASAKVSRTAVLGVGMSVPAPVEVSSGIVLEPSILPGWAEINPAEQLSKRLNLPVQADNDANLGALGEATWGAGRGCEDFVFLQVRTGIGLGLMLGGRIYRGAAGLAGELGHVTVDEEGPWCGCGNRGCLQQFVSEPAILRTLASSQDPPPTIAAVVEAAKAGDRASLRVLSDAGRHIGEALAAACNLLNPQRVIIGGELRFAGDLLLASIRSALERRTLGAVLSSTELVPAELGPAAEVRGALTLVLLATDEHLSARVASTGSFRT
ncbi:ROK family protein [Solirubrobacter soli]|uniref:ROK family protein n=1 Tax=Solirubrobacter soli TaxID=363832 RepID=UPI0003F4BD7B|nr:ROK family protein [Solirubrobacter soli]